jgi:hypothetical protein
VVDLHPLNNVTQRDVYPIPTIDDIILLTQGKKFISVLDAAISSTSGASDVTIATQVVTQGSGDVSCRYYGFLQQRALRLTPDRLTSEGLYPFLSRVP